jgi:hypothetical protein
MTTASRILLLLLCAGILRVSAQDRTEQGRDQQEKEKKRTEQKGKETEGTEGVRRVSVPPSGSIAPRLSGGSGREERDIPVPGPSSERGSTSLRQNSAQAAEIRNVFNSVEDGFSNGSIGRFSPHFGSQVSLNLRGGETGSYSANQAYYVLENYLRSRKLVDFELQSLSDAGADPFATGTVAFAVRSGRETAQVYIALANAGGRWVITEINIY